MKDEADGIRLGDEPVPGMRLRCICRGHEDAIGRIAWSPCGRFIASPSRDNTVRVWEVENGECLSVLNGHDEAVWSVEWSSDGAILASAGQDENVILWDGITFKMIGLFKGHSSAVNTLAWLPGTQKLASGDDSGLAYIWDCTTLDISIVIEPDEMHNSLGCLQWSSNGMHLAGSYLNIGARIWSRNGDVLHSLLGSASGVTLAWSPDSSLICVASHESIHVMDVKTGQEIRVLEGHTQIVTGLSFSSDGTMISSKSTDDSVRLWSRKHWAAIGDVKESSCGENYMMGSLQFSRRLPLLATLGEEDRLIRVWDIDIVKLGRIVPRRSHFTVTSCKIILVGESNVGKSCLATRLAENRYPDDTEHETTHGMRFWPMRAEDLHHSAQPPEGQRRDVVLWDFGGQDEYQLVHQLFLKDTTLALVLIDPTRGQAALDHARLWNLQLQKHLQNRNVVKLLIGAKQDRSSELVSRIGIEQVCRECGFKAYLEISARTGRNIEQLRKAIAAAVDWQGLAKTSRPELFQVIRDDVERRRKKGEVVVLLEEFREAIQDAQASLFEAGAVGAVTDQLAAQGVIVRTRLTGGDEALVLQLPVIERYAGSLIVAARNNPRGVPVLEERLLGSARTIPLPGMSKKERLKGERERIVLECIVELMIEHGLCFRHGGLLVFPTLFPTGRDDAHQLPHGVSLYYDFTGAIDNIYASLVARLMVGQEFGDGRLWAGRVEFDRPGQGVCGIRQIKRTAGLAHVDLFFSEDTDPDSRDLFTRFVEQHLRLNGVEIREHQAIKCRCEYQIDEEIVQKRILLGYKDVLCPICGERTLISEGIARIRDRNPESENRILALRKRIEEKTAEDAEAAKRAVSSGDSMREINEPIRILHISDLHFTGRTSPKTHIVPLVQDIRNGEHLGFRSVEYLVISGDMTDCGGDEGFDKAREFVEQLIDEMELSAQRCILVPGNHDVQDLKTSYRWENSVVGLNQDQWVQQGDIYLVRNEQTYPSRLQKFSDAFFHKITKGEPYPLDPKEQGRSYLFPDTRVQFLTLNSAWQIDQFNRKRSAVHFGAVTGVIAQAERQIAQAIQRGDLEKNQPVLRLAVWHHALAGPQMMQNIDFISNLQMAGVKVCLHGDVHEMRCELIGYKTRKELQIVGAGSFGSPAKGRPESTPRLYNVLEIEPDFSKIRVHTRERRKSEGAWGGWYEWPDPDGGAGRVPYFDIRLT